MIKKCILRSCSDNMWPLVLMVLQTGDIHQEGRRERDFGRILKTYLLFTDFDLFVVIFQLIVLIINRAPQYPPKNLGITTHFGNTIKDKCPIYRLLFFNNCTNQINVSYYTLLFLCTHTINYLNWRNYKIGKSDQYNGWVDHVWEADAVVIRDTFKS